LLENRDEIKIAAGGKRDVFTSTLPEQFQCQELMINDEEEEEVVAKMLHARKEAKERKKSEASVTIFNVTRTRFTVYSNVQHVRTTHRHTTVRYADCTHCIISSVGRQNKQQRG
jgi:hypothetical protein